MTQHQADDLTAERAAALLSNIVGIVPMTEQQRATRVQWLVDYAKTARQEALREACKLVSDYNCMHDHGKKATKACDDIFEQLDRLASEGAVDASQAK